MLFKHLIPGLACVAILSGCAGTEPRVPAVKQASIETTMAEADAAIKAGHGDKAYKLLQGATNAYPTDKAPWLRMAQIRYDNNNYGEAIVNAQEAIERDAADTVAHSIIAVSGLRVASKALADLTVKNNLTGSVRTEAQDLAKLLRTSLGEEVLVPKKRIDAPAKRPVTATAVPPPKTKTSATDPFGALNQ